MHAHSICEVSRAPRLGALQFIEVRVENADEVDKALNEATLQVTQAAMAQHTGILITRVGAGQYLVRVHPDVPFGLTRQQYR